MAKQALGAACTGACQCSSGYCVDGVCCNSACTGACKGCKPPALTTAGTCGNYPLGTDPDGNCGLYTCTGNGTCWAGCDDVCSVKCKSNAYCLFGKCASDLSAFSPCLAGCVCVSNTCLGPFGCSP